MSLFKCINVTETVGNFLTTTMDMTDNQGCTRRKGTGVPSDICHHFQDKKAEICRSVWFGIAYLEVK